MNYANPIELIYVLKSILSNGYNFTVVPTDTSTDVYPEDISLIINDSVEILLKPKKLIEILDNIKNHWGFEVYFSCYQELYSYIQSSCCPYKQKENKFKILYNSNEALLRLLTILNSEYRLRAKQEEEKKQELLTHYAIDIELKPINPNMTSKVLDEYIENYKNKRLERDDHKNVYEYKALLNAYLKFLKSKEAKISLNNVFCSFNEFKELLNKIYPAYDSAKSPCIPFIEFFLLLEDKKYIRAKGIDFIDNSELFEDENGNIGRFPNWESYIKFEALNRSDEIENIEGTDWIIAYSLKTRPDTMNTWNDNIAHYKFRSPKGKYGLLLLLMNHPNKRFSLEEIKAKLFHDESIEDEASKRKVEDLAKDLRRDLKLDDPSSKVRLVSGEETFLFVVPN
ncbi:MAG: hypothetical protein A2287_08380 [Candidatus Melainabacteria bacterium RIFOXYA12_FULL_32_12]|nr:MAG: hypothetical protein A2287_08380 [Candidatus Melainabacteria bacterium RIFOXYA12_FULL_32_12]